MGGGSPGSEDVTVYPGGGVGLDDAPIGDGATEEVLEHFEGGPGVEGYGAVQRSTLRDLKIQPGSTPRADDIRRVYGEAVAGEGEEASGGFAKRHRDSGLYPNARSAASGQTSSVGQKPPDVMGTPWYFELTHGKKPNIKKKLEQAEQHADDRPCVVVAKWDGMNDDQSIVAMRLVDWERLAVCAQVLGGLK